MAAPGWNHNAQYHRTVIAAIPSPCRRALDVGCGRGQLAGELAKHCTEVVAIDRDTDCIAAAAAIADPAVTFLHADIFDPQFAEGSFDFIAVVATLHHLPLHSALERFRSLLASTGVLAIIGLYRNATPLDFANAAMALPISRTTRLFRGTTEVGAPLRAPKESLSEIRAACNSILPGGVFRRRFFFRYSFVWQKP
jgi:2-polyprenyl-3-methyl-5-hydroxy-6-metoxy-1,4-benzoquinol methylase